MCSLVTHKESLYNTLTLPPSLPSFYVLPWIAFLCSFIPSNPVHVLNSLFPSARWFPKTIPSTPIFCLKIGLLGSHPCLWFLELVFGDWVFICIVIGHNLDSLQTSWDWIQTWSCQLAQLISIPVDRWAFHVATTCCLWYVLWRYTCSKLRWLNYSSWSQTHTSPVRLLDPLPPLHFLFSKSLVGLILYTNC